MVSSGAGLNASRPVVSSRSVVEREECAVIRLLCAVIRLLREQLSLVVSIVFFLFFFLRKGWGGQDTW